MSHEGLGIGVSGFQGLQFRAWVRGLEGLGFQACGLRSPSGRAPQANRI